MNDEGQAVARNTTTKTKNTRTRGNTSAAQPPTGDSGAGDSQVLAWMTQTTADEPPQPNAKPRKTPEELAAARRQVLRESVQLWERARGRAWALWVHRTAERILDEDPTLPPSLLNRELLTKIRDKLEERKLASKRDREGSDRVVRDDAKVVLKKRQDKRRVRTLDQTTLPPVGQTITGREMDHLVLRGGNGWSRWENGDVAPEEVFPVRAEEYVPGSIDFWTLGPGRFKGDPVRIPLWAMLQGTTSVNDLWLPVMLYRERQDPDARSLETLGGLDTVAYSRKQRQAGAQGEPDDGHRPLADTVPGEPLDEAFAQQNQIYHAERLAAFGPQEILNLLLLGGDRHARERWLAAGGERSGDHHAPNDHEPLPEGPGGLFVADVLVLALATSFTAGERTSSEWQRAFTQDKVFYLLRTVHRRVVAHAAQFDMAAPVRRWLRRMHSDYLDRNGIAFMPHILDVATLDPEAFSYEGARPGRRSGEQRLSRRP